MADEQAKIDQNSRSSLLGVTDDANEELRNLLVDPATGRLLVSGTVAEGVTGPASSTDNAIARWNGTGGDAIQNSGIIIDDSDNVTGVTSLVIDSNAGLDISPGSDTNTDLITLNVTGTPTFSWIEANDRFSFTHSLEVPTGGGIRAASGGTFVLSNVDTTGHFVFTSSQTLNSSSGTDLFFRIAPTINETGTAGYNALEVDVTETATGSGTKNLLALQVGNADRFTVNNSGAVTTGSWTATTIAVANGGTGATTLTGLLVGNGTSAFTAVAAPSGTVVGTSDTQTLTNKRITKRTGTVASSATPTINTDSVDFYSITALAANITSFTTNLSGTPTEAQTLWISITDDGTPRTLTFGASFEASTVPLPTTTVTSTRLDIGFVWNVATSKWRCVSVA